MKIDKLGCSLVSIVFKGISLLINHANFLVALATLITSVVACHLSYEQTKIVDNQLELMRREKQPIFEISLSIIDSDSDGRDDTECLRINLIKNEVKEIMNVRCYTYYKLEKYFKGSKEFRIDSTIYVPVNGYFGSHGIPYGHVGNIVSDTTENNFWSYSIFRTECLDKTLAGLQKDNAGYSCCKIDFIEIDYKDVYGLNDTVFFEDSRLSTRDSYLYVEELADKIFGNNRNHFYSVKLDDVLSMSAREKQ